MMEACQETEEVSLRFHCHARCRRRLSEKEISQMQ